MRVASGHPMNDVLSDGLITGMMFHERIEQSQAEQWQASTVLDHQVTLAHQRVEVL
jgi:hypothetical protein